MNDEQIRARVIGTQGTKTLIEAVEGGERFYRQAAKGDPLLQPGDEILLLAGPEESVLGRKILSFTKVARSATRPEVGRTPPATAVRPTNAAPAPEAALGPQGSFANPYNFVDPSSGGAVKPWDAAGFYRSIGDIDLMRFHAGRVSGELHLRLTAKTDLFTAGGRSEDGTLPFYRVGKRLAIRGSSVRGMTRSLFEAVTGSCPGVFHSYARPFVHRERPDAYFGRNGTAQPGLVLGLAGESKKGEILKLGPGWRVAADYGSPPRVDMQQFPGGEQQATEVWPKVGAVPGVVERDGNGALTGYWKVGGPMPAAGGRQSTKRRERFFRKPRTEEKFSFTPEQQERYNATIEDAVENGSAERGLDLHKLAVGDVVYFTSNPQDKSVKLLFRTMAPRLTYAKKPQDLGAPWPKSCPSEKGGYCPACAAFGRVGRGAGKEERSLRGRIRFSHALASDDAKLPLPRQLPEVLAAPKPQTNEFYIAQTAGVPLQGGQVATYDDENARLRGRKFYWHHQDAKTAPAGGGDVGQGTTKMRPATIEPVNPGTTFTATISFDDLETWELGGLLWCLLQDGDGDRGLKLGYAKPLGYGSLQVTFDKDEGGLSVWKPIESLTAAGAAAACLPESPSSYNTYIDAFKKQVQMWFDSPAGTVAFASLPHVRDLITMLTLSMPSGPIEYPRMNDPKKERYEWFVANRRRNGGPQVLPSIQDEADTDSPTRRLRYE